MSVDHVTRFFGITDVGRKRDHNEDAYYICPRGHYCILADGMGGRNFGEVAANMSVQLLRERFDAYLPASADNFRTADQANCADMMRVILDEWIREINFEVWNKGQQDLRYREMGTTLIVVYALPSLALVAHIGDSRVYHLHEGEMHQVTNDHSLVNTQVENGMLTREEAQTSNQKNIITRAIGTGKAVKPDFDLVHTRPGDKLLLCSDGLTDMVAEPDIKQMLMNGQPAAETLESLVATANTNGGRDNITAILIEYDE
jgi:PPM family protein phosphatase